MEPPEIRTIDAMRQTAERLWPGSSVRLVEGRRSGSSSAEIEELLVVPRAASARMLVPGERRAAARAVQRFNAAITPRELATRLGLSFALRAGGSKLLPDRVEIVGGRADGITSHLGDLLGEPVSVSLGIGSVRANRKPVLGVFDSAGRLLAYVKVGDTRVATAHVRGEATALETINAVPWNVLRVPRLIDASEWNGMFVLTMTALSAPAWQGRSGGRGVPDAAMHELSSAFDGGHGPLAATKLWADCASAARLVEDAGRRERLLEAMARVESRFGGEQVRTGAWHGDFTPWNIARRRDTLMLWDWERFSTDALFGMDRLHYVSQEHVKRAGFSSVNLIEGLRLAARDGGATASGGTTALHDTLAVAYALSLSCRYLLASEDDGGAAIAAQADVVLGVLEHLCVAEASGARF